MLVWSAVVDPDRETARRWAVEELTRQEYVRAQPGLLQQGLTWVLERISQLLERAGSVSSGAGLLVGVLVVVVVVVLALLLAGPLGRRSRRRGRTPGAVFGTTRLTAAQHRDRAGTEAAAGRWTPAVQERFRAVARDLEERALLDERPGRTAHEVAVEASVALPDAAAVLGAAARAFDDVTYGERPGTPQAYEACVSADETARRSRPQPAGRP